jgi:hypothetical protein
LRLRSSISARRPRPGAGPVILSAVTAVAGLGGIIVVSGFVGFAAAAALWAWIRGASGGMGRESPAADVRP